MEKYSYRGFAGLLIRVGYEGEYLTSLERVGEAGEDQPSELTERVFAELGEYFAGKRKEFDIPYGETRSYREIAGAVGSPKAFRAVGGANHMNRICVIIPCHRVVNADGGLGGYGGGLDMKKILLKIESENKNG